MDGHENFPMMTSGKLTGEKLTGEKLTGEKLKSLALLDPSGPPAHSQIEQRLAEAIEARELAGGDKLPAERDLADLLGVSRMTLRQALSSLERRGLLLRKVGRRGGTFVAAPRLERDLTIFAGLSEQLRQQGLVAGAEAISATSLPATRAVADGLALSEGSKVYRIERRRLANGQPIALERSFFPAERFPGLLERPLGGSLYEVLARCYGARPVRAVERLEPVVATRPEAKALGLRPGSPVMLVERVAYDGAGEPVELARDLFRGDRARMVVWVSEVR
ncbi:MAG: GntR family transcriptional regulator [Acidimicrobiales bacterium]